LIWSRLSVFLDSNRAIKCCAFFGCAFPVSTAECRVALQQHMPELEPLYDQACEMVGGDDRARWIPRHHRPPPIMSIAAKLLGLVRRLWVEPGTWSVEPARTEPMHSDANNCRARTLRVWASLCGVWIGGSTGPGPKQCKTDQAPRRWSGRVGRETGLAWLRRNDPVSVRRHGELKDSTLGQVRRSPQPSAVSFDDRAADR
jgi:hypothetical protein